MFCFFFFQAEDGIRDIGVTGVQTCALPISSFEDAALELESLDCILMDAVIEHFISPLDTLQKCQRILRPGGIICLRTPKFGGPAYRMHGRAWNGFRHGYHTFLFDGRTLGAMLEQAGFEVLRKPRRDRPLD